MPKLLLINPSKNFGSTGKIVEQIGLLAESKGWRVCVAHSARYERQSQLESLTIGNKTAERIHALMAFCFDRQGLYSKRETRKMIEAIKQYNPDIIHLHNIHGYFLNYPILFSYLAKADIPIVWTMHDCWSFTGHCTYFDKVGCEKWKTHCQECNNLSDYPKAIVDRSYKNFENKRRFLTGVKNITMVPVSDWLGRLTKDSFMGKYPIKVIHNGIDLNRFHVINDIPINNPKKIVLGVSSNGFARRKGLKDFILLSTLLPDDYQIVLIGLLKDEQTQIPSNIIGMSRTANVDELVSYYNQAAVFINPTYSDNFPTTNLEALACGTPVITYDTGGSPEAIDEKTGIVVKQGDVNGLAQAIVKITSVPKPISVCRKRAEELFNKDKCFEKYIDLYNSLISV